MPSFVNQKEDGSPSIEDIRNTGGKSKSTLTKEAWIVNTFESFLKDNNVESGKVSLFKNNF